MRAYNKSASELIDMSAEHGEIVTHEYDPGIGADLHDACDGRETNDLGERRVHEYWGKTAQPECDDDGTAQEWRVHLVEERFATTVGG